MGLYGERCLNGEVCLWGEDAYTIEGGYMVYVLVRRTLCGYGYSRLYLYFESAWVFLDMFRKVTCVPWAYLSLIGSNKI